MRAIDEIGSDDLQVIAPTPYFPPVKIFPKWANWSRFPRTEVVERLPVKRPRYPMLPKIGGYAEARLMYPTARRAVERLIREGFDFDLIDSHFVYPGGVLGTMLGQRYDKPVVMTGRGEDMLRFPGLPIIGPQIRSAIRHGDQFIALSEEIAEAFRQQGAPPERVTVIPNGVDIEKFRPLPMHEARERMGLPLDRPVIVSVGNLQERKGFHLLVDALPRIHRTHPGAVLVIVGGPAPYGSDCSLEINRRIEEHRLEDHVKLVGSFAHEDLYVPYSAADVFALLSSREGSPNVLMEALACGTPAVATPVGGIPETLVEPHLGVVLPERSATAAAEGLTEALGRSWDREAIRRTMEGRSWQRTAEAVTKVFDCALASG